MQETVAGSWYKTGPLCTRSPLLHYLGHSYFRSIFATNCWISFARISGSSKAAKWPPRGMWLKETMLTYFCLAHRRGQSNRSLGNKAMPVGTMTGTLQDISRRERRGRGSIQWTVKSHNLPYEKHLWVMETIVQQITLCTLLAKELQVPAINLCNKSLFYQGIL